MGFETSRDMVAEYGDIFSIIHRIILGVFVIEIALRLSVYRLSFFRDPWSVFDFIIVSISLVPTGGWFEVLRVLRVLRLFRLISVVPAMRKVMNALVAVLPWMWSIAAILSLFYYVFAIMAVKLFGEDFPEWFWSLGAALYSLFQIMTLESWSMGIVRPVMEIYPHAWVFFVIFIIFATFVMINLVVAIVVDAMQSIKEEEQKEVKKIVHAEGVVQRRELDMIQSDIEEIKKLLIEMKK